MRVDPRFSLRFFTPLLEVSTPAIAGTTRDENAPVVLVLSEAVLVLVIEHSRRLPLDKLGV